ncbi:MAG: PIN domain-containing protein [Candidatus Sumerlaeota bacterium]|nr:PIN domain-containing protein [Candidatus Sumerlaeota bacterium]
MKLKIYLDTSVISAYFDFRSPARQIITQRWVLNNAKEFDIFASLLVLEEIERTPDQELQANMVRLLNSLSATILDTNSAIFELAGAYREQVLHDAINDTAHIATASYYRLDAIVSWNFRHIVNFKTMRAIHDINARLSFPNVQILSLQNLGGDQYGAL